MDAIWHLSNVFITLFLIKYYSKGSYSLLYGGLRRIEARKIRKIEEFWWKKQRTTEKWQPHSDEKSTKMKGLLRPQIFYAHNSKYVQSIWKQYRPLGTFLCFSRWSWKRTPTASQKQKQIGHKNLYFFEPISSSRVFQHFSHSIAFAWSSHYYESGKNVFRLGIPTIIKFETNIELKEICLDGRHLTSFKSIHHPFLIIYQSKSIYSLLYWVLQRYEARKITKIEEFWWNK